MTRRRWIADEVTGNRATLIGEHARHLAQVLRAKIGQEFDISTGAEVRRGRICTVAPDRVEFELAEAIVTASEPQIIVALSIFKFDRMEWAIEKCTELGVIRIIPVIAARTEPQLAAAASKRVERWRRIAYQASEQSRCIHPTEISDPAKLEQALAFEAEDHIVLSESEQNRMLKDALAVGTRSIVVALGPEGGWKERELAAFATAGWQAASLGPTILRTETAAITAVAIAASMLR